MQQALSSASGQDPSEPARVAGADHDDAGVLLLGELLESVRRRRVGHQRSQLDGVDVVDRGGETRERGRRLLTQEALVGMGAWAKRV